MNETSSITSLKGIGEKTKDLFAKMGVYTVGDILLHFPRTYIRYPKMEPIDEISSLTEENHAIVAQVRTSPVVKSTRRMQLTLLTIGSVGYKMQLIWYRQPYIRNNLKANQYYVFYGKVTIKEGKYVMEQPVIYEPQAYTHGRYAFPRVFSDRRRIEQSYDQDDTSGACGKRYALRLSADGCAREVCTL